MRATMVSTELSAERFLSHNPNRMIWQPHYSDILRLCNLLHNTNDHPLETTKARCTWRGGNAS